MIAGGGMSGTAVQEGAGAQTQLANLITWGATVVTLLLLHPLIHQLARSSAGRPDHPRYLAHHRRSKTGEGTPGLTDRVRTGRTGSAGRAVSWRLTRHGHRVGRLRSPGTLQVKPAAFSFSWTYPGDSRAYPTSSGILRISQFLASSSCAWTRQCTMLTLKPFESMLKP